MGKKLTKREARVWIRRHWAALIEAADMGAVADLCEDAIDEVWSDECRRIAKMLERSALGLAALTKETADDRSA